MSSLFIWTYFIVTSFSIAGGVLRYVYPKLSCNTAKEVEPVNFIPLSIISFIVGIGLSTYFYLGISSSNIDIHFILQLGLLSGYLIFKNIDRLHKVKFNTDI